MSSPTARQADLDSNLDFDANLQQQAKDQAAEDRVVAATAALVKQQSYDEAGLGRQGAAGLGCEHTNPNPNGDPKGDPKHDPNPSHRCEGWSSVVRSMQRCDPNPKSYPEAISTGLGLG